MDKCIPDLASSSIPPVANTVSGLSSCQLLHLPDSLVQGVSVKFIPKTRRSYNYTGSGSCDGYLVSKLVQFMFFPLADSLHIHPVQGVNFSPVLPLLCQYPFVQVQFIPVNINPGAQFPFHVAYEPSGYGTHFLIRFPGFTLVSRVIPEALIVEKVF